MQRPVVHVLLVEDDPGHAAALRRALDASGRHDTRLARSVAEFRVAARQAPPDVALIDIHLPDGRATDLLAEPTGFPLVLMTSFGNEELAVATLRAGAAGYVVKSPEAFAQIARTLDGALREWDARAARRAAEALLRESEERHRTVLETTHDWVWEIDADGHCTWSGARVHDILGYAPEEILGHTPFEFMPPDEARRVAPEVAAIMSGQRAFKGLRNVNVHRDGRLVVLESSGLPLLGPDGTLRGYRGCNRDVTERVRAENEAQRTREQLEETVRQLEETVASAKAIALRAEQASAVKTEFLDNLSHELYTPLNGVIGIAQILAETTLDEDQRALLGTLEGSAERLLGLVRETLEFADVENRALQFSPAAFHLRGVFNAVVRTATRAAQAKGLALRSSVDPRIPRLVRGDAARLRHVLANLAENAVKFTDSGQVTLSAELQEDAPDGLRIRFTVADTGIGIDPEVAGAILEPFTQADGSLSRRHGGLGLGLTMAKELAELMGGSLAFRSEPLGGSVFTVDLPFGHAEAGPVEQVAPLRPAARPRVLVADDEPAHAEAIRRALADPAAWAEVRVVGTLAEYRAATERDAFDVALVDLNLPDGRATELLTWPPETGPFPVLVMTSFGNELIAVEAVRAGAMDYIVKSTEAFAAVPRTLHAALREWWLLRERREAHDALSRAKEDWERTFDTVSEAIAIVDAEGRLRRVNHAAAARLGRPEAELLGRSCLREIYGLEPEDPAAGALVGNESVQSLDRELPQLGGTFEIAIYPLRDGVGRLAGAVHVARDVTDKRVAERDRLELERRLMQAQRMEAIGLLAGGIAHDFNNILTPIMAHAELGLMGLSDGEKAGEDFRQILVAAQRAADLVSQILAISRPDDAMPTPVDLGLLAKEAVKLLRASLPPTIEIRTRIEPGCRPVLGHVSRLHQVVLNLCTNARDAMADGGGMLSLQIGTAEIAGADGSRRAVRLSVSDTGTGIAPEIADRIFEPYFTTKARGKGTGLGLAVAHGIVRSLGGEIDVRSVPGQGSTFDVLLPAADDPEGSGAAAAPAPPRGAGQRILVVDDEPPIREVLRRMLVSLGYRVTSCATAADALATLSIDPADIDGAVFDYSMPGTGGIELAQRALALRPDLPILLATGFAEDLNEESARLLGLRSIVQKPYSLQRLAEALRTALAGVRLRE